ncbi:hypothetical protein [Pseudogracilibacillus sp. ICA-222130]
MEKVSKTLFLGKHYFNWKRWNAGLGRVISEEFIMVVQEMTY